MATAGRELILCVPGTWTSRADFLRRVITTEPMGDYLFAGGILAHIAKKEHVACDIVDRDERIREAFGYAGQGIDDSLLDAIEAHASVAYLHFALDLPGERERILKYSTLMRKVGGIAVKVESSGVAHSWERWFELLAGTPFDWYCASVVLVGDEDGFYSCGMHHFGLPESMAPRSMDASAAADLMNRFNFWQIAEKPVLSSGHTFSVDPDSPHYRLNLVRDHRHRESHLFFNPHGVWALEPAKR